MPTAKYINQLLGRCYRCKRDIASNLKVHCCTLCASTKGKHHTLACDERHAKAQAGSK